MMLQLPHPTDGMSEEDKKEYFSQKTIRREVPVIINPQSAMVNGTVNDFTKEQRTEVKDAADLL